MHISLRPAPHSDAAQDFSQGLSSIFKGAPAGNHNAAGPHTGFHHVTPTEINHKVFGGKGISTSEHHVVVSTSQGAHAAAHQGLHKLLQSKGYQFGPITKDSMGQKTQGYTHASAPPLKVKYLPPGLSFPGKLEVEMTPTAKPAVVKTHKVSVSQINSVAMGGQGLTELGAAKAYTQNWYSQKKVHDKVHALLKDKGYLYGPITQVPGKNYLKSQKYTHPDAPDVTVEYHTAVKAEEKGGKVHVTLHPGATGAAASLKTTPHVPAKSAPTKTTVADHEKGDLSTDGYTHMENAAAYSAWKAKHNAVIDALSEKETSAVETYTGSSYHAMNALLRGKSTESYGVEKHIQNLQTALQKSTVGPPPILLYRGIGGKTGDRLIEMANSGKIIGTTIEDQGFVSTSISKSLAAGWGQILIHTRAPETAKGLFVKKISSHKGEDEVVLPPNAKFLVTGVKKVHTKWHVYTTLVSG